MRCGDCCANGTPGPNYPPNPVNLILTNPMTSLPPTRSEKIKIISAVQLIRPTAADVSNPIQFFFFLSFFFSSCFSLTWPDDSSPTKPPPTSTLRPPASTAPPLDRIPSSITNASPRPDSPRPDSRVRPVVCGASRDVRAVARGLLLYIAWHASTDVPITGCHSVALAVYLWGGHVLCSALLH